MPPEPPCSRPHLHTGADTEPPGPAHDSQPLLLTRTHTPTDPGPPSLDTWPLVDSGHTVCLLSEAGYKAPSGRFDYWSGAPPSLDTWPPVDSGHTVCPLSEAIRRRQAASTTRLQILESASLSSFSTK